MFFVTRGTDVAGMVSGFLQQNFGEPPKPKQKKTPQIEKRIAAKEEGEDKKKGKEEEKKKRNRAKSGIRKSSEGLIGQS